MIAIAGWLGFLRDGKAYGHLRPGRYYRVRRDFRDHGGEVHRQGQRWRYRTYDFHPHDDGLSLFFLTDRGEDLQIRLQDRADAEGPIIAGLGDILQRCEPPHRSAFAGLRAAEGDGLLAFDGVDRIAFGWDDITKATAAYGQQFYDATPYLTIEHRRGIAIFLPETEPLWQPFLGGLEARLPGVVPRQEWLKALDDAPAGSVRVFKRPLF